MKLISISCPSNIRTSVFGGKNITALKGEGTNGVCGVYSPNDMIMAPALRMRSRLRVGFQGSRRRASAGRDRAARALNSAVIAEGGLDSLGFSLAPPERAR